MSLDSLECHTHSQLENDNIFYIFHVSESSGGVQCCRLTLLLGPPGCGKTTFLLALAGKLNSSSLKVVIFVVSTSVKKKRNILVLLFV